MGKVQIVLLFAASAAMSRQGSYTIVIWFNIMCMPLSTGVHTHEGAGQCLYPSPHVEEDELLMCGKDKFRGRKWHVPASKEPSLHKQDSWIWLRWAREISALKGGVFLQMPGSGATEKAEKTLSISGLINTGCQSLHTQEQLVFAESKEL